MAGGEVLKGREGVCSSSCHARTRDQQVGGGSLGELNVTWTGLNPPLSSESRRDRERRTEARWETALVGVMFQHKQNVVHQHISEHGIIA
jgi:hypothetical protein